MLGQPNFTSGSPNQGGSASAPTVNQPSGLALANDQLVVSDGFNFRILVFDDAGDEPTIGINIPPDSLEGGRRKLTGTIKIDDNRFDVWKVEASVNGGSFSRVTQLDSSVQEPHGDRTRTASFYHEFEPWQNNNGDMNKWMSDFDKENSEVGYTVSVKAYNNNTDVTEHAFYFTPFNLANAGTDGTPQFSFRVNTNQHSILSENLDHYRLSLKPQGRDWYIAADNIPIDFHTAKDSDRNQRRGDYQGIDPSDGIYEDDDAITSYASDSTHLTTTLKQFPQQPYQARIEAVDKSGHVVSTNLIDIGGAYYQNANNLAITNEWFPLQINRISAASMPILSTINPTGIAESYRTGSLTPTFSGIAFANATVHLTVVNAETPEQQRTYNATSTPRSTWAMTPTLYQQSRLYFAVEDQQGRYNQLPVFALNR